MKVYPTKLGRWPALVNEQGRLVQMGKSHQANARWAADQGYEIAAQDPEARQLDLFGSRLPGAAR